MPIKLCIAIETLKLSLEKGEETAVVHGPVQASGINDAPPILVDA